MSEVMDSDTLHTSLFRPSVHLMVEIAFCNGENAVFLLDPVEHSQVVPHFVTEEIGHFNGTIAFLGFRSGNHILAVEPLIGLVDLHRPGLKVEVRRGEGQQLPLPNTAPVEHFKGVVGEGLVHHGLRKPLILRLCPEQHFLSLLRPHVPSFGGGVGTKLIEADSVVENGAELVVQGLEVGLGVGLALFVPIGQQLILPCDHVLGGDLADLPLAEVGQNLLLDDVLLCQPGVFFQPGPHVLGVKLDKGFKGHIHVGGGLHLKAALPVLGLPLGGKAPLALLLTLPRPVPIPRHDVPCAPLFVLKYRHFRSLPFWLRKAVR